MPRDTAPKGSAPSCSTHLTPKPTGNRIRRFSAPSPLRDPKTPPPEHAQSSQSSQSSRHAYQSLNSQSLHNLPSITVERVARQRRRPSGNIPWNNLTQKLHFPSKMRRYRRYRQYPPPAHVLIKISCTITHHPFIAQTEGLAKGRGTASSTLSFEHHMACLILSKSRTKGPR